MASVPTRTRIRGKGWSKVSSISTDKYETISRAILLSLRKRPITFSELVRRVTIQVRGFGGSIPWYTLTCLRELEVRGKVNRHKAPVLYSLR